MLQRIKDALGLVKKSDLEAANRHICFLNNTISEDANTLVEKSRLIESMIADDAAKSNRLTQLTEELKGMKERAVSAEFEVTELSSQLGAISIERELLKDQLESAGALLDTAQAEIDALKKEVESLKPKKRGRK